MNDTSKKTDKRTVYEIKVAFAIWLVAMTILHYISNMWGCLLSAFLLLLDIVWIIGMGKQNKGNHDR